MICLSLSSLLTFSPSLIALPAILALLPISLAMGIAAQKIQVGYLARVSENERSEQNDQRVDGQHD
jgi:hypothetical protein